MSNRLWRSTLLASLALFVITGCEPDNPSVSSEKKVKPSMSEKQSITSRMSGADIARQGNYVCAEWHHIDIMEGVSRAANPEKFICIHWVAANMNAMAGQ